MITPSKLVQKLRSRFRVCSVEAMGLSPGCPRPRVLWVLAPLLVAAGAVPAQPREVTGVLGGSVLLSPALPPNKTVKEIEWSFSAGAGATIQVAEFGPSGFKRPDPEDRFKGRLEMFNETALKIRALERGDSGVYGARIKLHPALVDDQSFSLSVYGQVPVPEIQHELLSRTAQACNVTLRCRVPAGSDAEVAWQLGSSLGMPWEQLCRDEDGQGLCLVLPASAFNSGYTCVARNPIQERNISIRLDTLCRQQETRGSAGWSVCLVLLAMSAGALLGIAWLWRKKRRKKAAKEATPTSRSSEDALAELAYAEIQRTPPEMEQLRDHPTTVYSQVQAGAGSQAEAFA